jgi:hypothetical protein
MPESTVVLIYHMCGMGEAKLLTQHQAPFLQSFLSLHYHGHSCQCEREEENDAV